MLELHEHAMFITSCYTSYLDSIDNSAIIDAIKQVQLTQKSEKLSNVGGYQSPSIRAPDYDNPNTFLLFEKYIRPAADQIMIGSQYPTNLKELSYWYNINPKYTYNREHAHAFSYMSGVYYVKVPENSGDIYFMRAQSEIDRLEFMTRLRRKETGIDNPRVNTTHWFRPQVGMLILFPGHISHFVEQNLTEEVDDGRISISFNFW